MWKTVILLIISLLLIPYCAINFDVPLGDLQKETLQVLVYIYLTAALSCFLLSSLTKNYSQVDKLWSIIPIAYVWVVAYYGHFELRLILMAIIVTAWGMRLTHNFSRRGGYSWKFWEGDEDYRWKVLQAKPEFQSPVIWSIFNLFFISLYQMGLILLFTLPILKSIGGKPLGYFDAFLSLVIIVLIVIEGIADRQQWKFQSKKYELKANNNLQGSIYEKGFIDTGLWGKVRHPNYAAEQAIWICFYFFSVIATGAWINWSIAGAILLMLLFKGSSDFSEAISEEKYPKYREYKKAVGRFLPGVY